MKLVQFHDFIKLYDIMSIVHVGSKIYQRIKVHANVQLGMKF